MNNLDHMNDIGNFTFSKLLPLTFYVRTAVLHLSNWFIVVHVAVRNNPKLVYFIVVVFSPTEERRLSSSSSFALKNEQLYCCYICVLLPTHLVINKAI